jgi:hypothetical protein
MDDPSTRRSAALMCCAPYGQDSIDRQRGRPNSPSTPAGLLSSTEAANVHDLF